MATILCIHGMWGGGYMWDRWRAVFEKAGHTVETPTLPLHEVDPDAPPPEGLGRQSLLDYADYLEGEIGKLREAPVLVGHSMGGLLAQILTARGLAKAAVFVCPAPWAGWPAMRELMSPSVMRTLLGHTLLRALWGKPHRLTFAQARYSTLNLLSETEARKEYAPWVHESGRALFEIGFWWADRRRAAKVEPIPIDVPTLTLSGGRDRIVPKHVVDVTARALAKRGGDYTVYPDHSHWIIREPGYETVAGDVVAWIERSLH